MRSSRASSLTRVVGVIAIAIASAWAAGVGTAAPGTDEPPPTGTIGTPTVPAWDSAAVTSPVVLTVSLDPDETAPSAEAREIESSPVGDSGVDAPTTAARSADQTNLYEPSPAPESVHVHGWVRYAVIFAIVAVAVWVLVTSIQ